MEAYGPNHTKETQIGREQSQICQQEDHKLASKRWQTVLSREALTALILFV